MTDKEQVGDDLEQAIWVTEWIRDNGGKVSGLADALDCVFRIHQDGERIAVNVGDTVIHEGDGRFRIEKAAWL